MVNPFLYVLREEFPGQGTALGVKRAAYITRRFVESEVMPAFFGPQGKSVQANLVSPPDFGAQKDDRAAIDLYPARTDEFFRGTPGSYPRAGQVYLESERLFIGTAVVFLSRLGFRNFCRDGEVLLGGNGLSLVR
jgi:hypothetical protein